MSVRARLKAAFFLSVLTVLSGCMAEIVEKKKPRKGPVPEVGYIETGGGEVRYSTDAWGFVVGWRRGTALRKARKVCRSKDKDLAPKIVDEWTHEDADAIYSDSGEEMDELMKHGLEHYKVAPYHHIVFECQPKEKPAPAAKEPSK